MNSTSTEYVIPLSMRGWSRGLGIGGVKTMQITDYELRKALQISRKKSSARQGGQLLYKGANSPLDKWVRGMKARKRLDEVEEK
jgi:hypothetical protein